MARKAAETKSAAKDPFAKVMTNADKAKKGKAKKSDVVEPKDDQTKQAVDEYKTTCEQLKHLEGVKTLLSAMLTEFAKDQYSARRMEGADGNFRIQGVEQSILYIAQNKGKTFSAEHREELVKKYGEETVDALCSIDSVANLQVNEEFFNKNYDKIVQVLVKAFGDEASELFLPRPYKVVENVLDLMPKHAKSTKQLREMLGDFQVTNYIRT